MRIVLEVGACVGHGRCYALDPAAFEPDDLGHCIVVATEVDGDALDRARRAVDACPEGALSLEG